MDFELKISLFPLKSHKPYPVSYNFFLALGKAVRAILVSTGLSLTRLRVWLFQITRKTKIGHRVWFEASLSLFNGKGIFQPNFKLLYYTQFLNSYKHV